MEDEDEDTEFELDEEDIEFEDEEDDTEFELEEEDGGDDEDEDTELEDEDEDTEFELEEDDTEFEDEDEDGGDEDEEEEEEELDELLEEEEDEDTESEDEEDDSEDEEKEEEEEEEEESEELDTLLEEEKDELLVSYSSNVPMYLLSKFPSAPHICIGLLVFAILILIVVAGAPCKSGVKLMTFELSYHVLTFVASASETLLSGRTYFSLLPYSWISTLDPICLFISRDLCSGRFIPSSGDRSIVVPPTTNLIRSGIYPHLALLFCFLNNSFLLSIIIL